MKVLFLILAATLVLFSCGNESASKPPTAHKRDTTLTLAAYLGYQLKGITFGIARKITIDTLTWVNKDSMTFKKEWSQIKYYDVSVQIPVRDSISAKSFGLKWNGKDTVIERLLQADSKYVVDGITDWDSASNYLKKYMDTSYNKPKKDTAK